jgi:hypothetical protein
MDLIARAREFAISVHRLIGHRRKYTGQPYEVHLAGVARMVATVTGDPEMVAAAWLHDAVEDTTATLADVEREFGPNVSALVEELTDISKPSDGSRAARKEIDRRHLAGASPRAKTIKLADLIDNTRDIVKYDPRFARVYLREAAALLEVLQEGDPSLYRQASQIQERSRRQLDDAHSGDPETAWREPLPALARLAARLQLTQLFNRAFSAQDLARPLRSFDIEKSAAEVRDIIQKDSLEFICLRIDGFIKGYARVQDLKAGLCGEYFRPFRPSEIVQSGSPPSEVVHVLTLHSHAYVSMWGEVAGVISREELNRPVVRMWLFGIITAVETALKHLLEELFPRESWRDRMPPGRLQKALALHEERQRRQQPCPLLECLQLSDKAQLLIEHPKGMKLFGFKSKRAALQGFGELESLRNNLAHAQDIAAHDWATIVLIASQLEGLPSTA